MRGHSRPAAALWSWLAAHAAAAAGLLGLLIALAGLYIAWRQWTDEPRAAAAAVAIARADGDGYVDAVLCPVSDNGANPFGTPAAAPSRGAARPAFTVHYFADLAVTLVNNGDRATSLLEVRVEVSGLGAGLPWTVRAYPADSTPDPSRSWLTVSQTEKPQPVGAAIDPGGSLSRFFAGWASEPFATAVGAAAAFRSKALGEITWVFAFSNGSEVRRGAPERRRSGLAEGGDGCLVPPHLGG